MMSAANPGFGGRVLGRAVLTRAVLSETSYEAGFRMPVHAHPNAYFCFVRKGAFVERWRDRSAEHQANEVIFHPPDDEHSDLFVDRARCFNIELAIPLDGIPREKTRLDRPAIRRTLTRLHSEFRGASPSPLLLEGLVYQAFGEAFERVPRGSREPRWLRRVRDEMIARFDQPLTLAELSHSAGVHPSHLARVFRRHYGVTIGDHLRHLRVDRALELLRNPTLSLAEVALTVGFADQSHFSRTFKRATGSTPGQYRRAL